MQEIGLSNATKELFQGFSTNGEALTDAILQGDFKSILEILGQTIVRTMGAPFLFTKKCLVTLVIIGIGASILKQLEHLIDNSQIQKTSFWIIYLVLAKEVMQLFYQSENVVTSSLERILEFGKVFVPTFTAALTLASGRLTGAGYMAALSFIIYLVDEFLLFLILPMIEGYMLLCVLGGLWQKERVEHILKLVEKGIKLAFKSVFAVIASIGLLQSMILPFVDHAKVGAAKKIIGLIPGVGKVSETTLEMISGSAILLKNGVGIVGILLLLVVCSVPFIKIGLLCFVMKATTVIYGLLGEKELTWCMDKLSNAQLLLLKTVGIAFLLFTVWILLAVYSTNQRLWS